MGLTGFNRARRSMAKAVSPLSVQKEEPVKIEVEEPKVITLVEEEKPKVKASKPKATKPKAASNGTGESKED